MIVFRRKGPWTVQIYYPRIELSPRFHLGFDCRLNIEYKKLQIGFELFGFGIGIMK